MKLRQILMTGAMVLGLGVSVRAENLALYTFTGSVATPEATQPFVAATAMTMSTGTLNFGSSAGFTNPPYAESTSGWARPDQASAKNFRFTLTELNGATFTITNIFFRSRATGAGPSGFGVSINGTSVFSGNALSNATQVSNIPISGYENLTSAFIQVQGWTNGSRTTAGTGDFRIDDILVEGTVVEPSGDFPPTVAIPTWANRTASSATLGGTLTATGGPVVTERGVYYSTTQGFTPPGQGTPVSETGVFGTGVFTLSVTGLLADTTYYFRAYALNSEGYGFSDEGSVKTLRSPPANALAYYTFTDNQLAAEVRDPEVTAANLAVSTGTTAFGSSQATTWEAQGSEMPYVESSSGWTGTTQAAAKHFLVTLTADPGRAMTITNISLIHRRTPAGPADTGISINGAGVYSGALLEDTTTVVNVSISGFENLTSAVVRVEGWNASSTGPYRIDNLFIQGFMTDEVIGTIAPTVESPTAADLSGITATLGGNITDAGDTTVIERGIYWSTSMGFDPETEGTKVSAAGSFGTGPFTVSVTGLAPETNIYYRAFARNSAGSGFSAEDTFLSGAPPPEVPTVIAPSVSDVTAGTAVLGGAVSDDGRDPVTRRGVVWSTSAGFDPAGGLVIDETGTFGEVPFSLLVSGLPAETRIYFRALAENGVGIGYSAEASFVTPPVSALVLYTFTGDSASAAVVATNLAATPLIVSTGTIAYGTANAVTWTYSGVPYARSTGGWTNATQAEAKYFAYTVTADAGWVFTITNALVRYRATGAGPSAMGLAVNGTDVHAENAPDSVTTLVSVPLTGYDDITSAVVHIQGWNNGSRVTSGGGEFQVDDVLLLGFVSEEGGPVQGPIITGFTRLGGSHLVTLSSTLGSTYELQYSLDLLADPVQWFGIQVLLGTGLDITLTDGAPSDPMRIYRVVETR